MRYFVKIFILTIFSTLIIANNSEIEIVKGTGFPTGSFKIKTYYVNDKLLSTPLKITLSVVLKSPKLRHKMIS